MARRLLTIPFIAVGAFQVVFWSALTMWALLAVWPELGFLANATSVAYLARCLFRAPSKKTEFRAWLATFIAWSSYHVYAFTIYLNAESAGGWVHTDRWYTTVALVAWIGSFVMFASCALRGVKSKNA